MISKRRRLEPALRVKYASLFALRNVLAVLDNVDAPARKLVLFWLSTSRSVLVPRALGNMSPSAEASLPFYRQVVRHYTTLQQIFPHLDPRSVPVSRLCECIYKDKLSTSVPARQILHNELVRLTQHLPEVQDFLWKFSWCVLPTKDRLSR